MRLGKVEKCILKTIRYGHKRYKKSKYYEGIGRGYLSRLVHNYIKASDPSFCRAMQGLQQKQLVVRCGWHKYKLTPKGRSILTKELPARVS